MTKSSLPVQPAISPNTTLHPAITAIPPMRLDHAQGYAEFA
ncbi:hypothetical protein [Dyella humicola]|nr:hypothetical protein [Dyella humicola]